MCITPLLSALPPRPMLWSVCGTCCFGSRFSLSGSNLSHHCREQYQTQFSLSHPHTLCVVSSRLTHSLRQCVLSLRASKWVCFLTENYPFPDLGWYMKDNILVQWHFTILESYQCWVYNPSKSPQQPIQKWILPSYKINSRPHKTKGVVLSACYICQIFQIFE